MGQCCCSEQTSEILARLARDSENTPFQNEWNSFISDVHTDLRVDYNFLLVDFSGLPTVLIQMICDYMKPSIFCGFTLVTDGYYLMKQINVFERAIHQATRIHGMPFLTLSAKEIVQQKYKEQKSIVGDDKLQVLPINHIDRRSEPFVTFHLTCHVKNVFEQLVWTKQEVWFEHIVWTHYRDTPTWRGHVTTEHQVLFCFDYDSNDRPTLLNFCWSRVLVSQIRFPL